MTPQKAAEILYDASRRAALSADDHDLMRTAFQILIGKLSEKPSAPAATNERVAPIPGENPGD